MKVISLILFFFAICNAQAQHYPRSLTPTEAYHQLEGHYGEDFKKLNVRMEDLDILHESMLIPNLEYSVDLEIDFLAEKIDFVFNFIPQTACPEALTCEVAPIKSTLLLKLTKIDFDYCTGIFFIGEGKNQLGEDVKVTIVDNTYNPCGLKSLFPATMVEIKALEKTDSVIGEKTEVSSHLSGGVLSVQ